jgi:glycine/sarcosine N-methyltransferase
MLNYRQKTFDFKNCFLCIMATFSNIAPYYDRIFPYKSGKGDFVESLLPDKPSYILDIGCATGALAKDLSRRGHFVTGIDLDKEMISLARQGSSGPDFDVMDMLQVDEEFGKSQFHLVSCLGNTLVQLSSLEKISSLLGKVRIILKPGGVFVMQNVNYDRIITRNISTLPVIEDKTLIFYRNYYYHLDTGLIEFNTRVIDKIELKESASTSYLYPLRSDEFSQLLTQNGFTRFDFYGDFDKNAFCEESPALVGVIRR